MLNTKHVRYKIFCNPSLSINKKQIAICGMFSIDPINKSRNKICFTSALSLCSLFKIKKDQQNKQHLKLTNRDKGLKKN